jgi:hypothetical protein
MSKPSSKGASYAEVEGQVKDAASHLTCNCHCVVMRAVTHYDVRVPSTTKVIQHSRQRFLLIKRWHDDEDVTNTKM